MNTSANRPLLAAAFLCAASTLPFAGYAATVVYDGGGPDGASGVLLSYQWPTTGGQVTVADDFRLDAASDVSAVRFWTFESSPGLGNTVEYAFYADDGWGQPTATPMISGVGAAVSKISDSAAALGGGAGFQYDFNLQAPVEFAADTPYWLGLFLPGGGDRSWKYSQSGAGATTHFGTSADGTVGRWFATGSQQAFMLFGAPVAVVPLPGTALLFGFGLAGLGAFLRPLRRR